MSYIFEKLLFSKNITIEAYNYSLITDQTIARKRERTMCPIFISLYFYQFYNKIAVTSHFYVQNHL